MIPGPGLSFLMQPPTRDTPTLGHPTPVTPPLWDTLTH